MKQRDSFINTLSQALRVVGALGVGHHLTLWVYKISISVLLEPPVRIPFVVDFFIHKDKLKNVISGIASGWRVGCWPALWVYKISTSVLPDPPF